MVVKAGSPFRRRDGQGNMKRCRVWAQYSYLGKKGNPKSIMEMTDTFDHIKLVISMREKKTKYTK